MTPRLPLYEAKMISFYDHRAADVVISATAMVRQGQSDALTVEEKRDPYRFALPRSYVDAAEVEERLKKRDRNGNIIWEWKRGWLLGWRDITSSTNERTVIASLIPRAGVGNNYPLMFPENDNALGAACLVANLSSFILDYVARQNVGGVHLNYFIYKQLPILPPERYTHTLLPTAHDLLPFLAPRVLELTYTAYDMTPFARDCGYDGDPFIWNEDRRFLLRCELDAAYFHLYGINRDDVTYIMDTFPIVRRKDEQNHGEYRTKRVILEIYDAMAASHYDTRLTPPPAHGWTPPAHLLTLAPTTPPTGTTTPSIRETTATYPAEAPELELVLADAPKPRATVQPTLDLPATPPTAPTTGLGTALMRVKINGTPATVYAFRPTGIATEYTAVLDGERAPRKFSVPPDRVEAAD